MKLTTIVKITVTVAPGANISDIAAEMLSISKTNNCAVDARFNEVLISAKPTIKIPYDIVKNYYFIKQYYDATPSPHIHQPKGKAE